MLVGWGRSSLSALLRGNSPSSPWTARCLGSARERSFRARVFAPERSADPSALPQPTPAALALAVVFCDAAGARNDRGEFVRG